MARVGECDSSLSYRRAARRLRALLPAGGADLYRSLRQLASRHDSVHRGSAAPSLPSPGIPGEGQVLPVRWFGERVAREVDRQPLRYSRRLQLLKRASRLGIERFEANLIISAVQHRLGARGLAISERAQPGPMRMRLLPVLVFVVVQSLVIAAAWRLAFG